MAAGWVLFTGVVILGLVVMAAGLLLVERHRSGVSHGANRIDVLIALGPALVAVGITLGENRAVGYSFIGAGVAFALMWAIRRARAGQV